MHLRRIIRLSQLFLLFFHRAIGPSRCWTNPKKNSSSDPEYSIYFEHSAFVFLSFHQGTIVSGDNIMRDPQRRDEISRKYHGALYFEMEAAGVMNDKRCLGVSRTMQIHTIISCGRITLQEWQLLSRENFFSQFSRRL